MIASSLLESAAALAVTTIVLATLTAALGASAVTSHGAWEVAQGMADQRHVEHLLDTAFARTLAAGGSVLECTDETVVLEADLDGDGSVDPNSSEHTAFSVVVRTASRRALTQQLGRQSMTLNDTLPGDAALRCIDGLGGSAADASLVRVVGVPVTGTATRMLVADFGA
jgi:hypothetical protein